MTGCIVGWAHTPFGKHEGEDVEALMLRVIDAALADAGVEAKDIDRIFVGHFNAGFSKQDFPASLALQAAPGLRFKPATRVENACATGSAAIHAGLTSLAARQSRLVLVVGVEKMTDTPPAEIGANLLKASYLKEEAGIEGGFAGIFARIAQQYFQRYGDKSDALARIAAKNHRNGVGNPLPRCARISASSSAAPSRTRTRWWRRRCGAPIARWSPTARRRWCWPTSRRRWRMKKAIVFRAAEQVNDFLPMSGRDIIAFEGPRRAWAQALASARLGLDDLEPGRDP